VSNKEVTSIFTHFRGEYSIKQGNTTQLQRVKASLGKVLIPKIKTNSSQSYFIIAINAISYLLNLELTEK